MTNIRALPELSIPCSIETNQDWNDALAFVDVNGNPVALDGIAFQLQCRSSEDLSIELLDASTANGLLVLVSAAALVGVVAPGAGYLIGDTVYLAGGTSIALGSVVVTSVLLSSVTMVSSGAGYLAGDTIVLHGGVATVPAVITVDSVDGSGHILTFHVSTAGSYNIAPTTLTQGSTSGTGSGATFGSPIWGVSGAKMASAGSYSVLPSNPIAQASTPGTGVGASFALTWVNNAVAILVPAANIAEPLIIDADIYQIQAVADGYTQNVVTGALTVTEGVVR